MWSQKKAPLLILAWLCLLTSPFSFAEMNIKLSGFLTAGVAISDNEDSYLGKSYTDKTDFSSDSILGLQIDSRFNDKARISGQLVAQKQNDFEVEAEWLYIAYRFSPATTARAGRLRMPLYSVSSFIQVSSAYLWQAPPETVYDQTPFNRYHGVDLTYTKSLSGNSFAATIYAGELSDDIEFSGLTGRVETDGFYGIRLDAATNHYKTHLTYLTTNVKILAFGQSIDIDALFFAAGLTFSYGAWETNIEWARTDTDSAIFGVTNGGFITQSRSLSDWSGYITYGISRSEELNDAFSKDSSNITVGLKFDDDNNLTWKAELHHGKAEPNTPGQFNLPTGTLPQDPTVNLLRLSVSTTF